MNPTPLNEQFIPRCPKCLLIPSIKLIYENNESKIKYECQNENKHSDIIPFNKFEKDCRNYSLDKIECLECKKMKNDNKDIDYFYCFQCKKTICYSCWLEHNKKKKDVKHCVNSIEFFDGTCLIHNNSYDLYCVKCKKNICSLCKEEQHKNHELKYISSFKFNEQEKEEFENQINEILKINTILDNIQKSINSAFENFKSNFSKELQFIKHLFYSYNFQLKFNNQNYNVINNLISFKNIIQIQKIEVFENIKKASNKFINLLNNIKNISNNTLQKNIRTLKYHTAVINNIILLNDGRLSSCSSDNNILIYNKNTYEIDIQIKDNCPIYYHIENKNNNIISCSHNILKIYSINNNNYNLIDTLKGHTGYICKIIEIQDNILISCSSNDKTMKIWKMNNNKYDCINNLTISNILDVISINENKIVSFAVDYSIIFWDNYFKQIKKIELKAMSYSCNSMQVINDNILLIGVTDGIYIINTDNYQTINHFKNNITTVDSIIELSNGNILIGCYDKDSKHSLIEYKYENNDLIQTKFKQAAHDGWIRGLIEKEDGTIISSATDNIIKFWY